GVAGFFGFPANIPVVVGFPIEGPADFGGGAGGGFPGAANGAQFCDVAREGHCGAPASTGTWPENCAGFRCNGLDVFLRARGSKNASYGFAETLPAGVFGGKLFAAGGGEAVEASLAIFRRGAPCGGDPALLQETLEGRVEGAVLDFEGVAGSLLNELGDGVTVEGSPAKGAEDDEVEG